MAVELAVPGRHNVLNALAALAACRAAGLPLAEAAPALRDFSRRRRAASSSTGARPAGALVFDDYAHHPTEVRATLEAARTLEPRAPRGLLPAPPLLAHAGARARASARRWRSPTWWWCVDVYPARERAEDFPGVSGLLVAAGGGPRRGRPAGVVDARPRRGGGAAGARELREGDLLLTLGAGDVDRVARALTEPAGAAA